MNVFSRVPFLLELGSNCNHQTKGLSSKKEKKKFPFDNMPPFRTVVPPAQSVTKDFPWCLCQRPGGASSFCRNSITSEYGKVPGIKLSFSCDWKRRPANGVKASSGQDPPQGQGSWLLRVSLWSLGVSHCYSLSASASSSSFSALAFSMSEDGHLPAPELTLPQFKPSEESEKPHKVEIPN